MATTEGHVENFLGLLHSHSYDALFAEFTAAKAGNFQTQICLVRELRDNIEIVSRSISDYEYFLKIAMPVFLSVLTEETHPQFIAGSPQQQLRFLILETLERLSYTGPFRIHVKSLLKHILSLLPIENEENALICLKIIMNANKAYKIELEEEGQIFLNSAIKIFEQFPATVHKLFSDPPDTASEDQEPSYSTIERTLLASMNSFRVFSECPINVVLLLQVSPRLAMLNATKFVPLIMQTLALHAPDTANTTHRTQFNNFIHAKGKALSFLAYLRKKEDLFRGLEHQIPELLIQLLRDCPGGLISVRRELLIAARHLVATDMNTAFVSQIDAFLDEHLLIGSNRTCYESLRPLAYSMVADLVFCLRNQLNTMQLWQAVQLSLRYLNDQTLPYQTHVICLKLIVNLVACLDKERDKMMNFLICLVAKFSSLRKEGVKLLADIIPANAESQEAEVPNVSEPLTGLMACAQGVIQSMNHQMINIVVPPSLSKSQLIEEATVFSKLYKNMTHCMKFFAFAPRPGPAETKQLCDSYLGVLNANTRAFNEFMANKMDFYFNNIAENIVVFKTAELLINGCSHPFIKALLPHLVDRLEDVSYDKQYAHVLRLLKDIFTVQSPACNIAPLLRPHVVKIVMLCLQRAKEFRDTDREGHYLQLVRFLFVCIAGHAELSTQFSPHIVDLLNTLNQLRERTPKFCKFLLGLTMILPVFPVALLPHVQLFIRPLLLALESKGELVGYGLRWLGFIVEKVSREQIEPIIENIKPRLKKALYDIMSGTQYADQAQTIVQKMPFLEAVEILKNNDESMLLVLLHGEKCVEFPLAEAISATRDLMSESPQARQSAFKLITSCLSSILNSKSMEELSLFTEEEITRTSYQIRSDLIGENYSDANDKANQPPCAIRSLLLSLFISSTLQDEQSETDSSFFAEVCSHFSVLLVTKGQNATSIGLDPSVFVDAIIGVIALESGVHALAAQRAIPMIYSVAQIFYGNEGKAASLPIFEELALRFCALLHNDPATKLGGYLGISCLVRLMPDDWLYEHRLPFLRGLLQALQEVPGIYDEALPTFATMLNLCKSPDDTSVLSLLASSLLHISKAVRKAVYLAFELLAQFSLKSIYELLAPFLEQIRNPIFEGMLKTQPTEKQMAIMDTVKFFLQHRIKISNIVELIEEVLVLVGNSASIEFTISTLELLSASVYSEEILKHDVRCKIFSFVPEKLIDANESVRASANITMQKMKVFVNNLPKNVVSNSLRPVLMRLVRWDTTSLPLLQGLTILLEHYPFLFNPTLGAKLLENLNQWLESKSSTPIRPVQMMQQQQPYIATDRDILYVKAVVRPTAEEMRKIIGYLEIFNLLPAAAEYLGQLIALVLKLESAMSRVCCLPFRASLLTFLNKYPAASVEYFLQNIGNEETNAILCDALRSDSAGPLRQEFLQNHRIATLLNVPTTSLSNVLPLVRCLVKVNPEVLHNQDILNTLLSIWRNYCGDTECDTTEVDDSPADTTKERRIIAKIFLNYLNVNRSEIPLLFSLTSMLRMKPQSDFNFLREFYKELPDSLPVESKRKVLDYFLTFFCSPQYSPEHREQALEFLIIPIVEKSLSRKEDFIDKKFLDRLVADILETKTHSEATLVQILKLITLMVQFDVSDKNIDLMAYRKAFMLVAWSQLKHEDVTVKQMAYQLVARSAEIYAVPETILMNVYVALLKSYPTEMNRLASASLDILLPLLVKNHSVESIPKWVHFTRKVIVDEPQHLVYPLIVRHPDTFYKYRDQFVYFIFNKLIKNADFVTEKHALKLAEVIIKWEKMMRQDEVSNSQFSPIVVRVAHLAVANATNPAIALRLLNQALELWPTANLLFTALERILTDPAVQDESIIVTLRVLDIVCTHQPTFLPENIQPLQASLLVALGSDNLRVTEALVPVMKKLLDYSKAELGILAPTINHIGELLKVAVSGEKSNVDNLLFLLEGMMESSSSIHIISSYLPQVVSILTRFVLLKEHHPQKTTPGAPGTLSGPVRDFKSIIRCLRLCASQLGSTAMTAELKQELVRSIHDLVEHSCDDQLLLQVGTLLKDWITSSSPSLTQQECSEFILKLTKYERNISVALQDLVADTVQFVFSAEEPRADLQALKPYLICGMNSPYPNVRAKYFDAFDKVVERDLCKRVEFVLDAESWKPRMSVFAVGLAVDILLSAINTDTSIKLSFKPGLSPTTSILKISSEAKEFIRRREEFIQARHDSQPPKMILDSLRELVHTDDGLARQIWSILFPKIWDDLLQHGDKERIKSSILSLVINTQPRQVAHELIRTFFKCNNPSIEIPPELEIR